MDAKVPPLGWLDVTDVVIQITGIQLGVDTVATYNFYSDLSKEPIAIVTMDNNQAFATQIMFKNTATVVDGLDEVNTAKPLAIVSPNPVSDEAAFGFANLATGSYRLAIFDETGRLALEKTVQVNGPHTERMNLSWLSPGMFFFSVFDENGQVLCMEKLMKN